MSVAESLHHRIQRYLRSVVEREREPVRAGSYVLYAHPVDSHPYLNYAIPAFGASGGDGSALVDAARARGLVPRLEYIEPCFPWVEEALAASGFVREARLRLMTCSPEAFREPSSPARLAEVRRGSDLIRGLLTATRAAFGEPSPDSQEVGRWSGHGIAALVGDEVVGGAFWTTVIDEMSEIAGVGVLPAFRGRGIGGALTASATRAAIADGATLAMLTPGDDQTARVYERAGFGDASTMLHLIHDASARATH